ECTNAIRQITDVPQGAVFKLHLLDLIGSDNIAAEGKGRDTVTVLKNDCIVRQSVAPLTEKARSSPTREMVKSFGDRSAAIRMESSSRETLDCEKSKSMIETSPVPRPNR